MKRTSASFSIALSAMACAVAAAALTMGSYVDVLLGAGYLLAVFALMVPLSKNFYWGSFLALVGALLLAFLFCGFSFLKLLPFACFLGVHPLLNRLQKNYIRNKIAQGAFFLGKAVWFDLALLVAWFVLAPVFGVSEATWYPWVAERLYYIIFLGGTAVFAAYDCAIFLCQRSVDMAIKRIGR